MTKDLAFYKEARANSAKLIARGLMKHAPPPPMADERIAADCRRKLERERIAASRKLDKSKGHP